MSEFSSENIDFFLCKETINKNELKPNCFLSSRPTSLYLRRWVKIYSPSHKVVLILDLLTGMMINCPLHTSFQMAPSRPEPRASRSAIFSGRSISPPSCWQISTAVSWYTCWKNYFMPFSFCAELAFLGQVPLDKINSNHQLKKKLIQLSKSNFNLSSKFFNTTNQIILLFKKLNWYPNNAN